MTTQEEAHLLSARAKVAGRQSLESARLSAHAAAQEAQRLLKEAKAQPDNGALLEEAHSAERHAKRTQSAATSAATAYRDLCLADFAQITTE